MPKKKVSNASGSKPIEQIGHNNSGMVGELHHIAGGDVPVLTTQQGILVADDQNFWKIGPCGSTTHEEFHFGEKIFHFEHEHISERIVHAHGFSTHGYFDNYDSLADIIRADVFHRAGERVLNFMWFFPVTGNKGSAVSPGMSGALTTQFRDRIKGAKSASDRGFPQARCALSHLHVKTVQRSQ